MDPVTTVMGSEASVVKVCAKARPRLIGVPTTIGRAADPVASWARVAPAVGTQRHDRGHAAGSRLAPGRDRPLRSTPPGRAASRQVFFGESGRTVGGLCLPDAELLEEDVHRAEVGEAALEEVEAHKGGEPQPAHVAEVGLPRLGGQGEAEEDEESGDDANEAVDGHGSLQGMGWRSTLRP